MPIGQQGIALFVKNYVAKLQFLKYASKRINSKALQGRAFSKKTITNKQLLKKPLLSTLHRPINRGQIRVPHRPACTIFRAYPAIRL